MQRFAQADPTPATGDGISISFPTVDWSQLIPQLVGYFFNAIGDWMTKSLQGVADSIWTSGANVLTQTPLDMTWGFGPIAGSVGDVVTASRAVLVFALILLGIRGMLGAVVPQQPEMLSEGVNGILGAIVLTAAFPVLVPEIIGLVNRAARSIAVGSASSLMNTSGWAINPFLQGVLFVILIFFGFRLLIKAVYRIGFLAVLLPIGMAACVVYAIPQLRWILGWWARTWGGMLVAQIPSTLALSIGLILAGRFGQDINGFVYAIAFMQLAHDMYDLIPFGMARSQGSPVGAVGQAVGLARMASGPVGAGAGAAAAGMRQLASIDRASATNRFYNYD